MSRIEKYYNDFYDKLSEMDRNGNSFEKIKNIIPKLKKSDKIIDIGSGYGSVSKNLVLDGYNVYALEINDNAITYLKDNNFKVYKRDLTKPLNINEKFNIVLLLDVLEHVFDPISLIQEIMNICENDGYIIISIPLYFDLLDRINILFTGRIVSLDNLCYGKLFDSFRSYNYDHIRFFNLDEFFELLKLLNLRIEDYHLTPSKYAGSNIFIKILVKLLFNKYSANFLPNLFSHSVIVRLKLQ